MAHCTPRLSDSVITSQFMIIIATLYWNIKGSILKGVEQVTQNRTHAVANL